MSDRARIVAVLTRAAITAAARSSEDAGLPDPYDHDPFGVRARAVSDGIRSIVNGLSDRDLAWLGSLEDIDIVRETALMVDLLIGARYLN